MTGKIEDDAVTISADQNQCGDCGTIIGPLEFYMVGDDEKHEVNYCKGCGEPVEEVLDL